MAACYCWRSYVVQTDGAPFEKSIRIAYGIRTFCDVVKCIAIKSPWLRTTVMPARSFVSARWRQQRIGTQGYDKRDDSSLSPCSFSVDAIAYIGVVDVWRSERSVQAILVVALFLLRRCHRLPECCGRPSRGYLLHSIVCFVGHLACIHISILSNAALSLPICPLLIASFAMAEENIGYACPLSI